MTWMKHSFYNATYYGQPDGNIRFWILAVKPLLDLNMVTEKYNLTVSTSETKVMPFNGYEPVRSKIIVYNRVVEQIIQLIPWA